MLDTMIFDYIVADDAFAKAVIEAVDAGRITIVTTHIQEEIAAIINDAKRTAISRIPRVTVATTGFAWDVKARYGQVRRR